MCIQVERTCLQFIDQNAAAVLEREDVLTLPEQTLCQILSRDSFVIEEMSIYNTILRWMEHNSVSEAQSLLDCVRLSEIPREELVDLSEPPGRFTQAQVLNALKVQIRSEHHRMKPRGRTGKTSHSPILLTKYLYGICRKQSLNCLLMNYFFVLMLLERNTNLFAAVESAVIKGSVFWWRKASSNTPPVPGQ